MKCVVSVILKKKKKSAVSNKAHQCFADNDPSSGFSNHVVIITFSDLVDVSDIFFLKRRMGYKFLQFEWFLFIDILMTVNVRQISSFYLALPKFQICIL